MANYTYVKIGELLMSEGLITREQLDEVIKKQKESGGRIGEALIALGYLKEEDLLASLAKQLNIPYASSLGKVLKPSGDQDLKNIIPKEFALKNFALPISRNLNSLTCAIADPFDLVLIDNLRKLTRCDINPIIATKHDIQAAIEEFYGEARAQDLWTSAVKETYQVGAGGDLDDSLVEDQNLSLDKLIAKAEEAPVVKLVDLIIRQAIDERASDIHIEPFKDRTSLRYRIDGKLFEVPSPARHLHLPIVSRVKILAKLDIAEKRLPQDGAFSVRLQQDRVVDLRISTIPTIYGEKVVIRILDKSQIILDLASLGFDEGQMADIRKAITSPFGLIFLTGPTGSGKTTTLYAILNELKDPATNILTAEDPVEYKLDGVNQVQVKAEIGLSFAAALRSFLRQDPDIILVGEVRDIETAEICVRSALTGHLVLSTLHTNDAPSAITRIIDIGIEPFLVSASLIMVVSQRLVRKLCPACKEAYEPTLDQLGGIKLGCKVLYRPRGCPECNQIGYKGRTVLAEVMTANEKIKGLISSRNTHAIREAALENGMQNMYQSGLRKIREGVTSLEEVLNATFAGD